MCRLIEVSIEGHERIEDAAGRGRPLRCGAPVPRPGRRLRGLGGTLTTAEDALIRLAALVTLRAEQLQADPLNGVTVATDDMAQVPLRDRFGAAP